MPMRPVKTDYTNITLTAEGCGDLPATVMQSYDGSQAIETCWELTPEEIAEICSTGRIYLTVTGRVHPPMRLEVTSICGWQGI